jgi:hypothetical protein
LESLLKLWELRHGNTLWNSVSVSDHSNQMYDTGHLGSIQFWSEKSLQQTDSFYCRGVILTSKRAKRRETSSKN